MGSLISSDGEYQLTLLSASIVLQKILQDEVIYLISPPALYWEEAKPYFQGLHDPFLPGNLCQSYTSLLNFVN